MGHARPRSPAENHLRRRSRPPDLLRGLSLQPLDRDQRGPMARSCAAPRATGWLTAGGNDGLTNQIPQRSSGVLGLRRHSKLSEPKKEPAFTRLVYLEGRPLA